MERVKLTAEDLQNAETYLPLSKKYTLVQLLAPGCMERTGSGFWRENIIGCKLVERYIFTGFYLHLTDTSGMDKEKPEFQFTMEDYDRLNGVKRDLQETDFELAREIRDDFRDFKRILNQEIFQQLAEKNDLLNRLNEALDTGLTPDVVEQLRKALEEAKEAAGGEEAG